MKKTLTISFILALLVISSFFTVTYATSQCYLYDNNLSAISSVYGDYPVSETVGTQCNYDGTPWTTWKNFLYTEVRSRYYDVGGSPILYTDYRSSSATNASTVSTLGVYVPYGRGIDATSTHTNKCNKCNHYLCTAPGATQYRVYP